MTIEGDRLAEQGHRSGWAGTGAGRKGNGTDRAAQGRIADAIEDAGQGFVEPRHFVGAVEVARCDERAVTTIAEARAGAFAFFVLAFAITSTGATIATARAAAVTITRTIAGAVAITRPAIGTAIRTAPA